MSSQKKSPRADGGQQGGRIPNSSTDILGPSLPWRNGGERAPEVWHSTAGGFAEWMADTANFDEGERRRKSLTTSGAAFYFNRAFKRTPTEAEMETCPPPRWVVNGHPRWDAAEFVTWLEVLNEQFDPEAPQRPDTSVEGWQ